jgi:ABC-type dipeptide/oligopeptide/nickel transport system ATPase component
MEQHLYKDKHIYIVGCSGSGKSYMVLNYFKEHCQYHLNYLSIQQISNMNDIFKYTHGSIMNMMYKSKKKNIVVIDDIDILNNSEKKILGELIKQIKLNKKKEETNSFQFIFIGINHYDKKVKELMKLCNVIHLKDTINEYEKNIQLNIKNVIEQKISHFVENEKATQCLMFHENIINHLKKEDICFYLEFLNNFCSGDYYDRVSFQKQLWIYNEMTYYLKMIYNYKLYVHSNVQIKPQKEEYRFTKVLTKYSNEYNNKKFILDLCNRLNISKQQLFTLTYPLSDSELCRLEKYLTYHR